MWTPKTEEFEYAYNNSHIFFMFLGAILKINYDNQSVKTKNTYLDLLMDGWMGSFWEVSRGLGVSILLVQKDLPNLQLLRLFTYL